MTNQEAFEKALRAMVAQRVPAYFNGRCYYYIERAPGLEPLRCAMGHLLSQEQIGVAVVHRGGDATAAGLVTAFEEYGIPLDVGFDDDESTKRFLSDLQRAHDEAARTWQPESFLDGFIIMMKNVATKWGLTFPSDV